MIKHIVMFKLKDADGRTEYENALEAQKRFDSVIAEVKELKKAEAVINSKDAPESNYTIALICEFDDIAALNAYQVHPAHLAFGKYITPLRESRACIDYEI
ncbi:MAG: Dabb family protein [Ruminococcus sp.]|nr:Dabb family protein [Ruminococcus sp.]